MPSWRRRVHHARMNLLVHPLHRRDEIDAKSLVMWKVVGKYDMQAAADAARRRHTEHEQTLRTLVPVPISLLLLCVWRREYPIRLASQGTNQVTSHKAQGARTTLLEPCGFAFLATCDLRLATCDMRLATCAFSWSPAAPAAAAARSVSIDRRRGAAGTSAYGRRSPPRYRGC